MVTTLLDECTPVAKSITLKVGCQVMLLKNINISLGLVNGARGIVEKFTNGEGTPFLTMYTVNLVFFFF